MNIFLDCPWAGGLDDLGSRSCLLALKQHVNVFFNICAFEEKGFIGKKLLVARTEPLVSRIRVDEYRQIVLLHHNLK